MKPRWKPIVLPDPARMGIAIFVNLSHFNTTRIPVPGTTLAESELPMDGSVPDGFAGYVYTRFDPVEEYNGEVGMWLHYRPSLTATETRTPFRTKPTAQPYGWPMVIRGRPEFAIDTANPRLISAPSATPGGTARDVYLPRGYVTFEYKPPTHRWTNVTIESYLSNEAYDEDGPDWVNNEPLAMPVEWDWYGFPGDYVALHQRFSVPPQILNGIEGNRDNVAPHVRDGVTFLATNREDWSEWETNEQDYDEASGMYVRTRTIYHPPAQEWLRK